MCQISTHDTVTRQLEMFSTDERLMQLTYAELHHIGVVGEGNKCSNEPGRRPADNTATTLLHRDAPDISSRSATTRTQQQQIRISYSLSTLCATF